MPKMHGHNLNVVRLITLVAEFEGIASAARHLGMSQPALSRTIRSFERKLGYALFDRDVRGSKPTEAAKVLVSGVKPALRDIEVAIGRSRLVAGGRAGVLRFGLNETVSWGGIIPKIIRRFREKFPDVELDAVPLHSTEQLQAIIEGRLDVGSTFYRPPDETPFSFLTLMRDPLVLAVHCNDPLAALREPVALSALAGCPLIWFERSQSPAYHDQVLAALHGAGVSAGPARVVLTTSTMLALVNVGSGYTFMPASAVDRKPASVVFRRLKRPDLTQTLALVWHRGDTNPAVKRLIECARAVLPGRRPRT